jgi:CheY-like chemotaxis protein
MAKKEYAFYPGCSSQKGASASNYLTSVEAMCKTLDVKLTEIPDWNCSGASIGYAEAGELPRHVLNARNFALSEQHLPGQEIVATCAACWLGARETRERLTHSDTLMADTREALKEAGYAFDSASDGEDAHFLGDTEPYDCVILDIGLPVMDGISVLQRWRTDGRNMPVLILTARDRWNDKVAGIDAGADDYLPKPFRSEELIARGLGVRTAREDREVLHLAWNAEIIAELVALLALRGPHRQLDVVG